MLDIIYDNLCHTTGKYKIEVFMTSKCNELFSGSQLVYDKTEWISISDNVAVSIIMQPLATDHGNIW